MGLKRRPILGVMVAESSPMRRGLKATDAPGAPGADRGRRIFPDEEGTESRIEHDVIEEDGPSQNLPR